MASSKVIASRSPPNSDLPRDSPTSSINIHSDQTARGFGSMNMDEIFRNIYPDSTSFENAAAAGEAAVGGGLAAADGGDGGVANGGGGNKTVDEVWRDYVASGGGGGGGGGSGGEPAMTLEDFLAKAGAVNEEDVRVPAVVTMPPPPPALTGFGMEAVMMSPAPGVPAVQFAAGGCVQNVIGVDFGSGGMSAVSGSGGRGKRRVAVDEVPLDKATQQKQRRMIKNRESAARSRERKQVCLFFSLSLSYFFIVLVCPNS